MLPNSSRHANRLLHRMQIGVSRGEVLCMPVDYVVFLESPLTIALDKIDNIR